MTAVMLLACTPPGHHGRVLQPSQLALMMTSLAGHVLRLPEIAIWTMLHIQSFPH